MKICPDNERRRTLIRDWLFNKKKTASTIPTETNLALPQLSKDEQVDCYRTCAILLVFPDSVDTLGRNDYFNFFPPENLPPTSHTRLQNHSLKMEDARILKLEAANLKIASENQRPSA